MSFCQSLKKKKTPTVLNAGGAGTTEGKSTFTLSQLNQLFGDRFTHEFGTGSDLSEVTYYTCLKILCEAVAKLSIHVRDGNKQDLPNSDLFWVLNIAPNEAMNPYNFKLLMEYWRLHYGNAYAYIQHGPGGRLHRLIPMDPRYVTIWQTDASFTERGYFYQYSDEKTGVQYRFLPEEIIHLKGGLSPNGIVGQCVRETLANSMRGNKASQDFLNELYKNGLTANAVLKYVGELDKAKKMNLMGELRGFLGKTTDRIIPIPLGMDIQALNLKLTDSQFFELKQFTSLQVAAAFGVPPNFLNDYSKSSYANSEMQNLALYVSTLLPTLTNWEEELNRKLLQPKQLRKGVRTKFNVSTILRGDIKTQADALSTYVTNGIYSINEARRRLDQPSVPNGDQLLINGTYTTLDNIGAAYEPGREA